MCNFIYGPVIFLAKLSLFLLLHKVFIRIRALVWLGIIFTFLLYSATTVAYIALCIQPVEKNYQELTRTPRCQKTGNLDIIQGVIDLASDLYLFAIPLPLIKRLQTRLKQRLGIFIIFSVGLLQAASMTKASL